MPTSSEPGTGSEVCDALAEDLLGQRLGHDQLLALVLHAHVRDVRADGQRGVGQQRPRGGGPAHERDALLALDREAHERRRVDHVLVAQRDLVRGQRGAAARAVGHDLVALVQQALVPHLLERPPDRLDVVVVHRVVGVVGVDPEADPLGQLVPLVDVLQDRLAALGVELGHAVGLDVVLGLEAQLLLDLQLDRQAVGVPAALAVHQPAAHGAVAREHVLEHAAEHVVRAGPAVGGRRALVEDVGLGALAPADRLAEHVALAPALEDLLLEVGEGLLRIDGRVAGHRESPSLWTRQRPGVEGAPPGPRRLLETARGVAGRSRTVQAAVARLEGVVLPEHLPERVRDDVLAAIESRPGRDLVAAAGVRRRARAGGRAGLARGAPRRRRGPRPDPPRGARRHGRAGEGRAPGPGRVRALGPVAAGPDGRARAQPRSRRWTWAR